MVADADSRYLHAWWLRCMFVQRWVSTHKVAHLSDNSFCVLDELTKVNEHHTAENQSPYQYTHRYIALA